MIGLTGIRVDDPEEIRPAWDAALTADRPVVIDAVTDPSGPPLPPHITFEQAKHLAQAMMRGDSARNGVFAQSLRQMFGALVSGRS